jgi:uncharacterized membrane protein
MERSQATMEATNTLFRIGLVLGVGQVGTLDEVVFHQLLQWHNFYVHTTEYWRIVSDGLFHAFSSAMLLLGALLLWQHRRKLSSLRDSGSLLAGSLIGMGGFNLYDGIIQHKLLGLHPVREGVEHILPYDLAWNGVAVMLLVAGWLLWRRVRRAVA